MIDRMEWGGRWGWSVWSTRALESLNNEQGVNSRTSMFCDVDDDADDSHVHHRRRNFRMIPEWKFRFFGGMWNFICEYLLKASVIQSVRAHTNRSRRHMILNEFPFAAFVRLLARIEIWIYILHSCVCDNNRILHIAYLLLMYRMRDHLAQMMWKMKKVISMPGCCLSHSSTIPHMAAQNIIIKFKLSGN